MAQPFALQVVEDHGEIARVLTTVLEGDPVANTVFGAIRTALQRPDSAGWAAVNPDVPLQVAARSRASTPVAVTHGWDRPRELGLLLAELRPPVAAVACDPRILDDLLAALGRSPTQRMDERLFRLDALTAPTGVRGAARRATRDDLDLLTAWYGEFGAEAFGLRRPQDELRAELEQAFDRSTCWVWEDGEPVSMAVRHEVAAGAARIGPVFTPRALRGSGYGSAVTAAATEDVLADGAVPCLFTDLANPTSNRIYRAIGYRRVLDRCSVRFG